MLTIAFVTGTEPGKWFQRFEEFTGSRLTTVPGDDPFPLLNAADGQRADIALMRLPDPRVGDDHHVVRLYEEAFGVAVPKESVYAEVGEDVDPDDLADEHVNFTYSDAAATDDLRVALQVVAANVGVAYAPRPLLKALSKKQIAVLGLVGHEPQTSIALVWEKAHDNDAIQDFVGVAKGRTARSSRGNAQQNRSRNRKKR